MLSIYNTQNLELSHQLVSFLDDVPPDILHIECKQAENHVFSQQQVPRR
jgi:hypothetical protein